MFNDAGVRPWRVGVRAHARRTQSCEAAPTLAEDGIIGTHRLKMYCSVLICIIHESVFIHEDHVQSDGRRHTITGY